MKIDEDIDALGLLCPLPVLKARKRIAALAEGQVLRLQSDDPAARIDVPHFCDQAGHTLVSVTVEGDARHFFIRKGKARAKG